jgi:hypothetical protein
VSARAFDFVGWQRQMVGVEDRVKAGSLGCTSASNDDVASRSGPMLRIAIPYFMFSRTYGEWELLHTEEIDVEDQHGIRWVDAASAARAVAQVRRNDQRALAADMHGGETLVPALNHLTLAE